MRHHSATISRWQWLLVVVAMGLVTVLPVINAANSCLLVEQGEAGVGEDVEFDGSLELMATLLSGLLLSSAGSQESVSDESVTIQLFLTASQPQRGPPLCGC